MSERERKSEKERDGKIVIKKEIKREGERKRERE